MTQSLGIKSPTVCQLTGLPGSTAGYVQVLPRKYKYMYCELTQRSLRQPLYLRSEDKTEKSGCEYEALL